MKLNEKGYALLHVIMIFTILMIFGISLLGVTLQSQKFTAYSEKYVQDLALAEMRMDEAIIKLEDEVNRFNVSSSQLSALLPALESAITSLSSEHTTFEPVNIRNITPADNRFSEMVKIKVAIGDSGKQLVNTHTITTAADVFRFSTVTEGKLIFNGATHIKGDVYANNGLYLSKYSKFITGSQIHTPETVYPRIDGTITVKSATASGLKIFEGKEPSWRPLNSISSIYEILNTAPKMKDRSVQFNQFNISQLVKDKGQVYNDKKKDIRIYTDQYYLISSQTINSSIKFRNYLYLDRKLEVKGDLYLEDGIRMTPQGSLKVSGNIYIGSNKNFSNYLSGNITLENNSSFIYTDGNLVMYDLKNNGQIYNSGDVYILRNFDMNGTVFVDGQTRIEDLSNRSGGTAVILSKGNLTVANNNLYSDQPREIDAFLYTDQDLEIYGVGSNIKINGGIYGKNITLNATKGNTYLINGNNPPINTGNFISIGGLYLDKNQSDPNSPSRLQIEFKPELIQNPPVGIPTVDKLQLTEIDQKTESK
ncbi:hypothetical protein [Metabacillus indicus]|uniref:hypothetical protein n=1 Tax=Metabacillus indicus TaxID=246786 RepID=UPI003CF9DC42